MNRHYYYPFEKNGNFTYSEDDVAALSEYEKYQISFHPERPKYLDYLTLFADVKEIGERRAGTEGRFRWLP